MRKITAEFLNLILPEGLSLESKVDRLYGVLMYKINVEKSISVEDATRILDGVKSGKSLEDLNIL